MANPELKALRTRLGLTQAELARAVGVAPNTLARWERGELDIPDWAIERLDSAARSGSSGCAVTRPRGVILDPHHGAIVAGLNSSLDPETFEACAADLLRSEWPGLVPVYGGHDDGFDGAVADGSHHAPFPLITTIGNDLRGNVRRNLHQARRGNSKVDRALFATSKRVTQQTRRKLEETARELSVTLLQIYDQDWFALRLYSESGWCKRLLRVTGRPRALSPFPITTRPVLGDQVLGRERDMRWLLARRGDCLLSGAPGSGKTFLLRALVLQGQGLFMVDDDREQIANDLRELSPRTVIIDDAHVDPGKVDRFVQIRREVGSDVRVIATSWPGSTAAVQTALQIPRAEVWDLDLIDADTMIEIIKSAGIGGPDELLFCIRHQAAGRPGLAATLAHLCLAGDVKEVVSGEALLDQLAVRLDRLIDTEAQRFLAPFALGGACGAQPERVARCFGKSVFDVTRSIASLAAAGIVRESRTSVLEAGDEGEPVLRETAAVVVEPPPIRWVLVRRIFFGGPGSLDVDAFLENVGSAEDTLDTLMGARARGASIPDLELRLERVARRLPNHRSASLWSKYASLGPSEARYVMERHPDLLLAVGPEALEQDPERVIPLLLDEVRAGEELPAADSLSAKPLGILTRWLTGPPRGGQDLLYRRSSLLRGADRWRRQGGDPNAAIRAMCIALAPRSDYATADPGAGRTITVHYDLLLQHHVESLKKLWPMVSQAVGETDRAPWTDLVGLAFGWLTPWAPPHGHVPDEIRTAMRSFAERMLRDLADVSRRHPGVQHQLRVTGERVGLNIAVTLDPEFEALHQELDPDEAVKMMKAGPLDSVVEAWEHRPLQEMTRTLTWIESEAHLAGIRYPRWSPYLCAELAKRVPEPVAVAEAFLDHRLPPDLVGPFILQAATTNQPRWPALVDRCLGTDDYRALGVCAVATHAEPPPELLATALTAAGDCSQQVDVWCLRGEVPPATLQKMLCSTDARVAVAAAIGYWCGHSGATEDDRRVPDAWRQAILHAPADETRLSQHEEYWLGEILSKNNRLAEDWLLSKFGRHDQNSGSWKVEEIAVKIMPGLDSRQRARVLAALRSDCHAEKLVQHLVADDVDLYRDLLKIERLARFHLTPLTGKPEGEAWRAKALLALAKGFTTDEIVQAALGRSYSWSGLESDMWAGWRRSFEALLDDHHQDIAGIGRRGVELTKSDERRALERERDQAVHGR